MQKAKKYDFKDSNMALVGSDLDRETKKAAAEKEKAWIGSGAKIGLEIFRVVKFKIQKWPVEDYGKFYSGDSYIILNTYQNPDEEDLEYDLHFWIGKYSTQDEYGTAAYKTVELDTFHNDKPVQHREIQDHESPMFLSYFTKGITYLKGGAESGFRHVKPTEYQPRLFQFVGETYANTIVKQVGLYKQSLNQVDVFILDRGLTIIQINTPGCDKDEKVKAMHFLLKLKEERNGRPKTMVIDDDPMEEELIAEVLEDCPGIVCEIDENGNEVLADKKKPKEEPTPPADHVKKLVRVCDDSGECQMTVVSEGSIDQDMLDPADVFVVDLEKSVYVWIGEEASDKEKSNGMAYAHKYVGATDRPLRSISVVNQRRAGFMYKDLEGNTGGC